MSTPLSGYEFSSLIVILSVDNFWAYNSMRISLILGLVIYSMNLNPVFSAETVYICESGNGPKTCF